MLIFYVSRKEKPDGIFSLTFDVNECSGLFLHPSVFSIIHSRSA